MSKKEVSEYLTLVTNQRQVSGENSQVQEMMKDAGSDELIDKEKFLAFYHDKAYAQKTIMTHFKNLNYRKDFTKLSEVHEPKMFKRTQMPRYTIANTEGQFDLLYGILKDLDV